MSKKVKHIKLWDGWRVIYDGDETICESPADVWKMFNWNIENDPNAKECADMITREMYCFGTINISELVPGHTLVIVAIPSTEESDWEDVEESEENE